MHAWHMHGTCMVCGVSKGAQGQRQVGSLAAGQRGQGFATGGGRGGRKTVVTTHACSAATDHRCRHYGQTSMRARLQKRVAVAIMPKGGMKGPWTCMRGAAQAQLWARIQPPCMQPHARGALGCMGPWLTAQAAVDVERQVDEQLVARALYVERLEERIRAEQLDGLHARGVLVSHGNG